MPLPTTLRVLVIHALRSICPKTQIDDINNDARGGLESQRCWNIPCTIRYSPHSPSSQWSSRPMRNFFKSHRIYKMLKGQAKPTPKRALDKFTNQVQRPTGALPWERNTDSSRRVSGVRYSVCVQREYLARKLAV